MDFTKWQGVIVEWVNCLKLSTPIISLNDLKDGVFLSSLLNILNQNETTDCILKVTLQFLQTQYPRFIFETNQNQYLNNISDMDLLAISSLLLHYSCVLDRRDVFTSPLCLRLSETSQIYIRTFLESLKNQITREEFFELIDKCVTKSSSKRFSVYKLYGGRKSCSPCSPLQELLQTPPSKFVRSQEKDREINKLRSIIDIEQFEKADLQVQLNVQQDRNKNLSKQLTDKTAEIVKLRAEIMDLENRSFSGCQDEQAHEVQKRLRSEIISLEKYITKLENEQFELHNESGAMKDKLRKLEGHSNIWHEKAISAEKNFNDLLEEHERQEEKLISLQSHCNEVTALLEELRSTKNPNESTIEVDTSVNVNGEYFPAEDLASAVVEVQLKDALKENSDLKNVLSECHNNIEKLREELNSTETACTQLQMNYEEIKLDNDNLLKKITVLEETQETLKNVRQELQYSELKVTELVQQNSILNSDIIKLQNHIKETEVAFTMIQSLNSVLNEDLKKSQSDYASLKQQFDDKTDQNVSLEEQVKSTKIDYDQLLNKYDKTSFELKNSQETLNKLRVDTTNNLTKLEKFAFGNKNDLNMNDVNVVFITIFEQLEKNYSKQLEENKTLTNEITNFKQLVLELKSELQEKEAINVQEKQTLNNNLKDADEKNAALQKIIKTLDDKIINLNSNISEMSTTITNYEDLQKNLEHQRQSLELINNSLSQSNNELVENQKVLTDKYDNLEGTSRKLISELSNKNEEFNKIIKELKNQKRETENETRALQEALAESQAALDTLTKSKFNMETENKKKIEDLQNEIQEYNQTIQSLNVQERKYLEEIHSMKEEINDITTKYTETLQTRQEIEAENEIQVNNLTRDLHELIEKYNSLDKVNTEAQEQLEKLERSKLEMDVKHLEEKAKYEEYVNVSNLKINQLLAEAEELKKELTIMQDNSNLLNDKLKEKSDQLIRAEEQKNLLAQNLMQINTKNKELKNIQNSLKSFYSEFFKETCESINHLKNTVHQFSNLNDQKTALELRINQLKVEQEELNANYNLQLLKTQKQIELLENEALIQQQNLITVEKGNKILEEEISTERAKHEEYKKRFDESKETIEELSNKLLELENSKVQNENKYTEDMKVKEEENRAQLNVLQSQLTDTTNKNNKLTLELISVNESLRLLTEQYQTLQKENEEHLEQFLKAQTKLHEAEVLLQNLQLEKQVTLTEKHELEEKLKNYMIKHQTLELEIKTVKEKLLTKDSITRRHESVITDTNEKLKTKSEEIFELEKSKRILQEKVEELTKELDRVRKNRDDILETQAKIIKETENNLIRAHENAIEVKSDLLNRIQLIENEKQNEKELRSNLEQQLESEKTVKDLLELKIIELTNEKSKFSQLCLSLRHNIQNLASVVHEKPLEFCVDGVVNELDFTIVEGLNENIVKIEAKLSELVKQNSNLVNEVSVLEMEKNEISMKLQQLSNERQELIEGKEQLLNEKLEKEMTHDVLKSKYEQLFDFQKNVKSENQELQAQIACLEKKTADLLGSCKKFADNAATNKDSIEKLISERNLLETTLGILKQNLASIQIKILHVSDEREYTKLLEQMQKFEIIIAEDIQKQFLRMSKKIQTFILTAVEVPVNIYNAMESGKTTPISGKNIFDTFNFDSEQEAVGICKDRANSLLEEMTLFEAGLEMKIAKVDKENILRNSNHGNINVKVNDDELRKRNTALKQRLILVEHSKNTLEKKLEQLRQMHKTSNVQTDFLNSNNNNTIIQIKQEYQKVLDDWKKKYNKLSKELEQLKNDEIVKLRDAYGKVIQSNSELNLENTTIRKMLTDRNSQLNELTMIKEAYEKLLEENNKLRTELDTIVYKRSRDREVLLEAQRRERDENKKIADIKREYEDKLSTMKNKMLQLYKEECDKESRRCQQYEIKNVELLKNNSQLKQQIKELEIELERNKSITSTCNQQRSLRDHDDSRKDFSTHNAARRRANPFVNSFEESLHDKSFLLPKAITDNKKSATLPKSSSMNVIREDQVLKCRTLNALPPAISQNLEMEDEDGDMFNNKYLLDLKEGRCVLPSGRESNASRLSELQWRNSLCPPHLKSSYPAETQFSTPGRFKEEDVKSGVIDFDESMSSHLLPGEKPRKKDIGTTSYKRPGPPTPSKNGGRVSLQGNEIHPRDVLKERNESKTPKRTTPSRLKALFMGQNSSARETSENTSGTPKSKRLSIFRKPKLM